MKFDERAAKERLTSVKHRKLPGVSALSCCLISLLIAGGSACSREAPQQPEPRRERISRRSEAPVVAPDRRAPVVETAARERSTADPESEGGLIFKNDWIRNAPWSINLLKIDRSHPDLELTTTLGRGRTLGLSPLSEQIAALPQEFGEPLAGVNGDFYQTEHHSYAGDPRGLQVMRGEFISAPTGKTAFWIDADGKPHLADVLPEMKVTWPDGEMMPFGLNEERRSRGAVLYTPRAGSSTRTSGGRELVLTRDGDGPWLPLRPGEIYSAQVRDVREAGNSRLGGGVMVLSIGPSLLSRVPRVQAGAILQISTATSPDLHGVQMAIGGGPVLIREGKALRVHVNKGGERHPRTAMGWSDNHFYFVQVDGRQHGFSVGMTLPELANYLVKQGCQEAMNLDGGGSAEMWVEGQVVNRPCYGYERNTANGLVVVRKQKFAGR